MLLSKPVDRVSVASRVHALATCAHGSIWAGSGHGHALFTGAWYVVDTSCSGSRVQGARGGRAAWTDPVYGWMGVDNACPRAAG